MNRLVMVVNSGDGCTWNYCATIPVLGECPDTLLIEFYDVQKQNVGQTFEFKGETFDWYTDDPYFITLDRWYEDAV
jgi:hypothetical protein